MKCIVAFFKNLEDGVSFDHGGEQCINTCVSMVISKKNMTIINDIEQFARVNDFVVAFEDDNVSVDMCDASQSHIACYLLMIQVQKTHDFDIVLRMNDDDKKIIHDVNDEFFKMFDYRVDFEKHDDRDTLYFTVENDRFVCAGVADDDDF